jgi:hypothetical protein
VRVACCVLRVACCVLRVACCVLRVACGVWRVACCVLRVACCVLRVAPRDNQFGVLASNWGGRGRGSQYQGACGAQRGRTQAHHPCGCACALQAHLSTVKHSMTTSSGDTAAAGATACCCEDRDPGAAAAASCAASPWRAYSLCMHTTLAAWRLELALLLLWALRRGAVPAHAWSVSPGARWRANWW